MNPWKKLERLLYPPKCVLCGELLSPEETDLCHGCRLDTPECNVQNVKLPHLAHWTALWYYKDEVRSSILRYKFSKRASYSRVYAWHMVTHLTAIGWDDFDVITWAPISTGRKLKRGFDQSRLLAHFVGKLLKKKPIRTLKKCKNIRPQSELTDASQRRANVLNVYKAYKPMQFTGKRILLLDDVVTTGSTVSECAKTLLLAGAKEVYCAALAAPSYRKR